MADKLLLEYHVEAHRKDSLSSVATTKRANITLDTGVDSLTQAFNPAELLLASIAACMIKGIERVAPMIDFSFSGVNVVLHAVRQDSPPKMISIRYELIIDTGESDQRLELLHKNVRKFGTVSNTIAEVTRLQGTIRRKR